MYPFKPAAIVALVLLLLSATSASPQDTPFGRIIVRDTSDRHETRAPEAWLIPMTMLEESRDQWTRENKDLVPEQHYGRFLDIVEGTRDHGLSGHCNPAEGLGDSSAGSAAVRPDTRFSIAQIAGDEKTVVVGEVIGMEAAWDVILIQVATLVHVKVTRVVRAVEKVAVGDVVTIRRPWGTATVRGVTLCTQSRSQPADPGRPAQPVPERERQQLLLVGFRTPGNRFYLNTGGFGEFQIIEGLVHYPQSFSFYRDQKPEKLGLVISSISGRTGQSTARRSKWPPQRLSMTQSREHQDRRSS